MGENPFWPRAAFFIKGKEENREKKEFSLRDKKLSRTSHLLPAFTH